MPGAKVWTYCGARLDDMSGMDLMHWRVTYD